MSDACGQTIDADRLTELLARGHTQLIDVRDDDRRHAGFIAQSRHIPAAELSAEAATLDRERVVVFYGGAQDDVLGLTEAFRAAGFTAYALAGGIEEWERRGHPIEGRA